MLLFGIDWIFHLLVSAQCCHGNSSGVRHVQLARIFCIYFSTGPVTCRNVLRISKYTTNEILHNALISCQALLSASPPCKLRVHASGPRVHAGYQ